MSFNIRYDNPKDGDNQWEYRKDEVRRFIEEKKPDFLGIQEALPHQLEFLTEGLPGYHFIGHARDGQGTNSEAVPLFYNKSKYQLLSSEVFWLSPTPAAPSKGWDAALPRIAVYGTFKDRAGNDTIYVINTHFDHLGSKARERSAGLLLERSKDNLPKEAHIILMGDLNCEPGTAPLEILNTFFTDTYSKRSPNQLTGTFNGFDQTMDTYPRIDYIFTRGFKTLEFEILNNTRNNGLFVSDHFAVWSTVIPE